MKKTEFERLDCKLFEPLNHSILKQIRGGDQTTSSMPTYNVNCQCSTTDATSREDSTKKKKKPIA
ncbi:hypothetical protein [Runella salmonicolor]|uniref:Bacteriocin n=1 Tax=Runella salmonicolor TaxID=2950278 RepID=A0ABT1FMV4_9BACT|nr:hypothetical protein [Runella salmonicolor]MCP1383086.1 hypothetical protein [Runella salmonicolor]